ncbi:MAG: glycosyltransferase family 2 protein [Lachnospiraceae bacterium]|nr:glycosyltransferase family 2 protein [Lachnospiraceae bacterium]
MIRKKPRVSVIIAIYNAERYLKRTLDSLMEQTYENMEMIFVEDGSTDASKAILARYSVKDERIRVLHQEYESHNASKAFNMGIDHANGDYLMLLNDYDIFEPDLVETAMKKADSAGADIVLYDAWLYDEGSDSDRYVDFYLNRDVLAGRHNITPHKWNKDLYDITSGCTWNMLVSRRMVNLYNIRLRDLNGAPDLEFAYLALSCAQTVSICYRRLVHNRRYAASNHRTRINEWPETGYQAYLNIREELKKRGLYETYKIAFANKVMEEVEYYLKRMTDEQSFLKLYNALHDGFLERLGVYEIPDRDFATRRAVVVRDAIRDMTPMEYLLNVKDDVIEKERDYFKLPYSRDKKHRPRVAIFGTRNPAAVVFFNCIREEDLDIVCWADFKGDEKNSIVTGIDEMVEKRPDYVFVVNPGIEYLRKVKEALRSRTFDERRVISLR